MAGFAVWFSTVMLAEPRKAPDFWAHIVVYIIFNCAIVVGVFANVYFAGSWVVLSEENYLKLINFLKDHISE